MTLLLTCFADLPRVMCPVPQAAFYAFFNVAGVTDSLAFAQQMLAEANVGLAPGRAFGPEGEGYLRLCYAVEPALLETALDRLEPLLK